MIVEIADGRQRGARRVACIKRSIHDPIYEYDVDLAPCMYARTQKELEC